MHREVFSEWREPPGEPMTAPTGYVDVWRIALTAPDDPAAPLQHGHRHAQHSMRWVLSRYLGRPADDLRITAASGGKPYLDMPGPRLEFNLSHSRHIALLAVSASHAVGIDVESHRTIDDPQRIARRVFTA